MSPHLILASGSAIRAQILRSAGVDIEVSPARIDEDALRAGFAEEGLSPRDQADALAEFKAQKVALRRPETPVLGCDQILALGDRIFAKPVSETEAAAHLMALQGQRHSLFSAAVLYHEGRPIWRHVSEVRLTMRKLSPDEIAAYVARTWPGISESVGGYKIEEDGIRLFARIDGDHYAILGLPLLPLLTFLIDRKTLTP